MSFRKDIAAAVKAAQPTWSVKDHPAALPVNIEQGKAHFAVYQTEMKANDLGTQITYVLEAELSIAGAVPEQTEDNLEAALDAALLVLQKMDSVFWLNVRRGSAGEQNYPSYVIEIQALSNNKYRSAVLTAQP